MRTKDVGFESALYPEEEIPGIIKLTWLMPRNDWGSAPRLRHSRRMFMPMIDRMVERLQN
jgi:hypothetical protein